MRYFLFLEYKAYPSKSLSIIKFLFKLKKIDPFSVFCSFSIICSCFLIFGKSRMYEANYWTKFIRLSNSGFSWVFSLFSLFSLFFDDCYIINTGAKIQILHNKQLWFPFEPFLIKASAILKMSVPKLQFHRSMRQVRVISSKKKYIKWSKISFFLMSKLWPTSE